MCIARNRLKSEREWIETARGSYQKGFTQNELKAYLEDALGDGFTVELSNAKNGGKFNNNTSIVVTKNAASEGGTAQFSLRTAEKEGFDSLINKYYKKTLSRADPVYVGRANDSSSALIDSSEPLIIGKADLDKSTRNEGKNKNYSAHGMDERFVRTLPERIDEAVLAYTENRNGVDSFTYVLLDEFTGNLAAVGGERNAIYEGRKVNRVLSMFDIGTPESFLTKAGKTLQAYDKNEVKELLEKARIQTPGLQEILDHVNIISRPTAEVKGQLSVRSNSKTDRELLEQAYERASKDLQKEQREALEKHHRALEQYDQQQDKVRDALAELDRLVQAGVDPKAVTAQRAKLAQYEETLFNKLQALVKSEKSGELREMQNAKWNKKNVRKLAL